MAGDRIDGHIDMWGRDGCPRSAWATNPGGWRYARNGDDFWFVYTMYEAQWRIDTPLYVGVTHQLYERLSHHRRRQVWWPLVGEIVVEHFNDRAAAFEAEERHIHAMRPLFNIVGNVHTPELEVAAL
jgi:predicted GIY-YIG superfamily endonuclease